jgi:hypothetical protein
LADFLRREVGLGRKRKQARADKRSEQLSPVEHEAVVLDLAYVWQ